MDNLRSFIVCIVVVFHAALAFMIFCPEWWPVADPQQNLFFTGVVLLTDVPIMPIMFLLAGYFGLESLRRRGLGDFWHDKFWRIVVPWLLGIVVIAPFCPYFLLLSRDANPPSFLHVLTDLYFTERYNTQGALWFLGVLTVFFGALSLVWAAWPALRRVDEHPGRPTAAFWVGFSAVVMVVFLAVNQFWFDFQWVPIDYVLWVQPTRVSLEAFYFVLGVHACRGRWFVAGGYRPNVVVWLPVAVAAGALLFVYKMWVGFLMPELWMRAGHAVLHCLFCLATTLALIGLFQAHADRTGAFLGRLAAASFGIYWVHMPIVFAFNLLVRGYDWNIYVKYLVVSALALVVSHLVASRGLLLLPIFGGRRLTSPRLLAR
ncbi:acyltransferase family protein [Siculibacillus lacustris]|uniref:acyltransferase family protein n=1 Tax=Siculibacillus lacustris TaxID=1549641 RepID=UPI0013F15596|nr:acyltransferase family protein [Siculibacillus lacustris]